MNGEVEKHAALTNQPFNRLIFNFKPPVFSFSPLSLPIIFHPFYILPT